MNCRYCGVWNDEDEHRCQRCGRRLQLAAARPAPDLYPIRSAAAPELHTQVEVEAPPKPPQQRPEVGARMEGRTAPVQRSLFGSPRVVQFEDFAAGGRTRRREAAKVTGRRPRRPALEDGPQQGFDFPAPASSSSRLLRTSVEAEVCCDAPVASLVHRLLAVALDLSIVVIASGVVTSMYYFAGGELRFTKQTVPVLFAVPALLYFFYSAICCIARKETPGMNWTGLTLLNFDGHRPTVKQRWARLGGTCLAILAGGLGILWALGDEESLAWQDHISGTFPSYRL